MVRTVVGARPVSNTYAGIIISIIGTKNNQGYAGIMDIINFKHKKLPYVAVWAAANGTYNDSNNGTTTYLCV